MLITFYGTGSAFNHQHGNNAALLEFNDTNLLLDCGHTTPNYLESGHIGIGGVDNIWISHLHGDHIGGLEEIGFQNRYVNNGKMVNLYVEKSLLPALTEYLETTMKYSGEGICTINDYFNICPVDETFTIDEYTFRVEKTNHIKGTNAYMLVGENFIYTADSQFIDWTEWDLNGIEYIFQDTQLFKAVYNVHAPLEDLVTLPENIKKKIYCMHYGQDICIADVKKKIWDNKMKIVETGYTMVLN